MSRNAKLTVALAAATLLAALVWLTQGHDPAVPNAAAPRGRFASERAAEEAAPPVPSKP